VARNGVHAITEAVPIRRQRVERRGGRGRRRGTSSCSGVRCSVRRGLRECFRTTNKVLVFDVHHHHAEQHGVDGAASLLSSAGGNEGDRRCRSRVPCRGRGRPPCFGSGCNPGPPSDGLTHCAQPGESSKCKICCSCLTNCKKLVKLSFLRIAAFLAVTKPLPSSTRRRPMQLITTAVALASIGNP